MIQADPCCAGPRRSRIDGARRRAAGLDRRSATDMRARASSTTRTRTGSPRRSPLTPRRARRLDGATSRSLAPGTRYAIRATGPHGPTHTFDRGRDLLDPYARGLARTPTATGAATCRTTRSTGAASRSRASRSTTRCVYEAHVKGLTKLQPRRARGAARHLRRPRPPGRRSPTSRTSASRPSSCCRCTSSSASSGCIKQGLINYWGYNTLNFFTPHAAYATPRRAARRHRGGAARVQGHGAAAARGRPRGHPRRRLQPHRRGGPRRPDHEPARHRQRATTTARTTTARYIDVTGCGNTVNFSSRRPAARARLAALLGERRADRRLPLRPGRHARPRRRATSSIREHPLLAAILDDPALAGVKMIAEPWDVGMGGWQVGNFPRGWSEWNDGYRDRMRNFWLTRHRRARAGTAPRARASASFARRLAGSTHVFSRRARPARQRQLRHRARRLHRGRPRRVRREAQPRQRRAQPRRHQRQPVVQPRRRRADDGCRDPGDAGARPSATCSARCC